MCKVELLRVFAALIALTVLPAGCDWRQARQARAEAAEAKAEISRLETSLAGARREIANLQEELDAVRTTRDELQGQIKQLLQERDKAVEAAERTRQTVMGLSARSDGQAGSLSALQNQVRQLETVIKTQQATISEQRATIQEQQSIMEELQRAVMEQLDSGNERPPQPQPVEANQPPAGG